MTYLSGFVVQAGVNLYNDKKVFPNGDSREKKEKKV
jgi:hypothetical protein